METIQLSNVQDLSRVAFTYGLSGTMRFVDGIMNDVLNDLSEYLYRACRKEDISAWDLFFKYNPQERKIISRMALDAILILAADIRRGEKVLHFSSFPLVEMIKSVSVLL